MLQPWVPHWPSAFPASFWLSREPCQRLFFPRLWPSRPPTLICFSMSLHTLDRRCARSSAPWPVTSSCCFPAPSPPWRPWQLRRGVFLTGPGSPEALRTHLCCSLQLPSLLRSSVSHQTSIGLLVSARHSAVGPGIEWGAHPSSPVFGWIAAAQTAWPPSLCPGHLLDASAPTHRLEGKGFTEIKPKLEPLGVWTVTL